ncbi:ATP-binding protein [Mahella australiensis]|uniref:IstB domain protein ATP-binding protein n=1 Tax=Mahella australiensis (strain DSM 15567 / CIP 107919 / 50-1 BON) TaxID=697281 RepID=F4A0W9_MAHA5|nr:ATP-binding protein [Mahella australiensis]AEE98046.1 IstB domain protein ATP-binding protein [Mahella australiensis 50-1 BON]
MNDELTEYIRRSIAQNEKNVQEMLKKEKQSKAMKLLNKSGLGSRFAKRTFETFDTANLSPEALNAYKIAYEFATRFPNVEKGLLFTGPVGTGKTHLAAAIANELISKLYSVIFGNVIDILTLVKSTYRRDSELTEAEMIRTFTDNVDILVIDDLGKENATENSTTVIYQIINRLYENERPIIVTTNFSSAVLRKKLGEKGDAIVSRLAEMCEFVKVSGEDWRLKRWAQ